MTKKILVADDSLTIQKVVELTFSDSDYQLVCVSNGQRALEKLQENRPDLILADVVMPEKNGYEVCEAVKANPATARIPVVLLSGTFEPFDRQRAERIGADAIVSKPFDSQQLLAQVEALLDRAPSQREEPEEPTAAPVASPQPASAPPAHPEPEPFDVGFSAEDFPAAAPMPSVGSGMDPFEEEYARGDVDSAIEAFEKSGPRFAGAPSEPREAAQPPAAAPASEIAAAPEEVSAREPFARWLTEEPEKAEPGAAAREPDVDESAFASEAPTQEIPQLRRAAPEPMPEPPPASPEVSIAAEGPLPDFAGGEAAQAAAPQAEEEPEPAEVPHEIEMLAQTASIPELNQMVSSVSKNGNELTSEQIDRIASRVIEKLSDRIVREIAWEVIPDMAEIVIKKRIKELESGAE